mgnify:CR=1 FL=1
MPAITIDAVRDRIAALYDYGPKPHADEVQAILDEIEAVPCEKKRICLFVSAKQFLGNELRELVSASRIRADRRWGLPDSN